MKDFIKGFIIRKGHFVSLALLTDKVSQLLAPYIIVMYVSQLVYGNFIYGMTIIGVMIPFSGGGLNHSLLYYGSDSEDKRSLFSNILITGSALNFILVLVILMLSPVLTYNRPDSLFYLNLLTVFMFFQFYHLILNNHYRINDSNLNYSKNNLVKSLIFVSAIIILVPNYGIYGLIIAYILSPLYSTVKSFKIFTYKDLSFKKSSKYIKYGVYVGLSS
ncbi:hypothetical protein N8610_00810, partial [Akkermansiaceae bacterium]|nr:hypothetical protein [Akkermansiaceae bacterium]